MQVSVRDAATYLNVPEKTIYRWIQDSGLPAYLVHDQYRFNRVELLEWAVAKRIDVSPDLLLDPESALDPQPSLTEAIRAGGVHDRVGGEQPESILRAVVALLPLPNEFDREFLLAMLLAREALGTTALGQGIAIPHPRSPIVLPGIGPIAAVCFLDHPMEFDAPDGKPVHTLFVLLCPSIRTHLNLLAQLAWVLHDPTVQSALAAHEGVDRLVSEIARAERPRSKPVGAVGAVAR
jgi:PTS system nitrogen regulatory IIA component